MHWKECKPLNSTWMEPRTCITYQCRYDQVLNDLFITEKQYGRFLCNICYKHLGKHEKRRQLNAIQFGEIKGKKFPETVNG